MLAPPKPVTARKLPCAFIHWTFRHDILNASLLARLYPRFARFEFEFKKLEFEFEKLELKIEKMCKVQ